MEQGQVKEMCVGKGYLKSAQKGLSWEVTFELSLQ